MGQRYIHLIIDTSVQPNEVLHCVTWRFKALNLRAVEIASRKCDPDVIRYLRLPLVDR